MCVAFDRFVNGRSWGKSPREPSAIVSLIVALRHKAQVKQDAIAERKKLAAKKRARVSRAKGARSRPSAALTVTANRW
jgi:hypothetical protein